MPAARTFEVEITLAVRVGLVSSPSEALAKALAELGIADDAQVISVSVQRRG
jgi:hypothetical protein